jgi:hypothetical protein
MGIPYETYIVYLRLSRRRTSLTNDDTAGSYPLNSRFGREPQGELLQRCILLSAFTGAKNGVPMKGPTLGLYHIIITFRLGSVTAPGARGKKGHGQVLGVALYRASRTGDKSEERMCC